MPVFPPVDLSLMFPWGILGAASKTFLFLVEVMVLPTVVPEPTSGKKENPSYQV